MAILLDVISIPKNTTLQQSEEKSDCKVTVTDPAMKIMTDFSLGKALTITSSNTMDNANEKMIAYGVRLLFVVEDDTLVGLITTTDTLGKKPVLYITEHGGSRDDITVKDLMTPVAQVEAIRFNIVNTATVGDVVETMQKSNRHHMLVLEEGDTPEIRGLLSMTQISKQLGVAVRTSGRANCFSEFAGR